MKDRITAKELRSTRTWIRNFMCDSTTHLKTFGELLTIFENCCDTVEKNGDPSRDVDKTFSHYEKLSNNNWDGDIEVMVVKLRNGFIEAREGLHRGIAYLKCMNEGISENDLPKVYLVDYRV